MKKKGTRQDVIEDEINWWYNERRNQERTIEVLGMSKLQRIMKCLIY